MRVDNSEMYNISMCVLHTHVHNVSQCCTCVHQLFHNTHTHTHARTHTHSVHMSLHGIGEENEPPSSPDAISITMVSSLMYTCTLTVHHLT